MSIQGNNKDANQQFINKSSILSFKSTNTKRRSQQHVPRSLNRHKRPHFLDALLLRPGLFTSSSLSPRHQTASASHSDHDTAQSGSSSPLQRQRACDDAMHHHALSRDTDTGPATVTFVGRLRVRGERDVVELAQAQPVAVDRHAKVAEIKRLAGGLGDLVGGGGRGLALRRQIRHDDSADVRQKPNRAVGERRTTDQAAFCPRKVSKAPRISPRRSGGSKRDGGGRVFSSLQQVLGRELLLLFFMPASSSPPSCHWVKSAAVFCEAALASSSPPPPPSFP